MNDKRNKSNIPSDIPIPDTMTAEYQVLSDLVFNSGYVPVAQEYLDSGMFSTEENRRLWEMLVRMKTEGETVDLTTVGTRISSQLVTSLMRYSNGVCSPKTVIDHCLTLYRESVRRTVYIRAYEMLRNAGDRRIEFDELISMPVNLADEIKAGNRTHKETIRVEEAMNRLAESIEANQVKIQSGKRTRIPTGMPFLDKLTYSGFNAGNLVILAARPSVGKTAVMLFMALAAARAGFPATVYSLEMTVEELAQRLLFATSFVSPKQVMSGMVDWNAIEGANTMYDGLPLYLNDTCRTIDDISADIILNRHEGRCDIAFIDYLGLIQSSRTYQTLYQSISDMTPRLKRIAKENGIPIVLLCQLNRNTESESRAPQLRDLRDSGSIEQDADIVLMLERESRSLDDRDINVWVRKNRQGRAGDVVIKLRANDTFTDFRTRETETAFDGGLGDD